jgi:hypothetical protein
VASSDNFLLTFRDKLSVPSSRVKISGQESWPLKIAFPKTSVRNYCYLLRNNPAEHSSHLLNGGSLKSRMIPLWFVSDCFFKVEYSTHCATGMDIKKLFPLVFILLVTMKFSFTGYLWSKMFEFTAVIDSSSSSTSHSEAWYQNILETLKSAYSSIFGHLSCHIKKGPKMLGWNLVL